MMGSLAGRGLVCLAVLGLLLPWAAPVRAQFSSDSCLGSFELPIRAGGTNGVRFVVTGDMNGDGHLDVVTASAGDDRIAWYEARWDPDQVPPEAPWVTEFYPISISTNADGATAVAVGDLNGDCATVPSGYPCMDVVSASANDNKIAWYRNNTIWPDPKFEEFEISTDAGLAQAVFVADINGDCATVEAGIPCLDVLSASFSDNKIAWYENDGQKPPGFIEHIVTTAALGASSVYAADMNGDDKMDILSASILDNKISWWEQRTPAGDPPAIPFTEHVITTTGTNPVSVVAADLDGDCATVDAGTPCMDVLVAFNGTGSDNPPTGKITWFRNDGAADPQFVPTDIKTDMVNARQVFALAPPGDVLAAYEDKISWFRNSGSDPWFLPEDAIDVVTGLDGAMSVHAADLDGDGVPDVQSASSVPGVRITDDKVLWYRNDIDVNDPPTFPADDISLNAASPESIVIEDIDDDCGIDSGNPDAPCTDVVSASSADDTVAWHRNDGEAPRPGFTQNDIDKDVHGAWSVFVADLNGDCPDEVDPEPGNPCLDVIAAGLGDGTDGEIVWYRNDLPAVPNFTRFEILTGEADPDEEPPTEPPTSLNVKPMSVSAGDVNGDCDSGGPCIDVIAAIRVAADGVPDEVVWFENDQQDPPTFTKHVISTNLEGPYGVYATDLDADGWLDVLVASTNDNKVTWFRNLKGDEETPTMDPPEWEEVLVTSIAVGAISVSVTDLTGDCADKCPDGVEIPCYCLEVLSASSGDNKIAWYDVDVPQEPAGPPPTPVVAPGNSGSPAIETAVLGTGALLGVDPDLLEYGVVFAGQDGATLDLEIRNDGAETLVITDITSTTANFAPSETDLQIPPGGEPQVISVVFKPTAVEFFSGTLEFTSNAVNDPPTTVELKGTGGQFVGRNVATDRLFARFVSAGDVDNDGDEDVLAASSGDGVIAAYLQQPAPDGAEDPAPTFQELIIAPRANDARSALVTDLNNDNVWDVATAFFFEISWHEGNVSESCNDFDVDGDQRLAGAELSWIWTSFGNAIPPGTDPEDNTEWWALVDFNKDGLIDGDDLAIATSLGVWTHFVSPAEGEPKPGPLCNFSCVTQD